MIAQSFPNENEDDLVNQATDRIIELHSRGVSIDDILAKISVCALGKGAKYLELIRKLRKEMLCQTMK